MKLDIDIPDSLFDQVKARSVMEGCSIDSMITRLLESSLDDASISSIQNLSEDELFNAPWLEIARRYVRPGMSHDLDEIDAAIELGTR